MELTYFGVSWYIHVSIYIYMYIYFMCTHIIIRRDLGVPLLSFGKSMLGLVPEKSCLGDTEENITAAASTKIS